MQSIGAPLMALTMLVIYGGLLYALVVVALAIKRIGEAVDRISRAYEQSHNPPATSVE